MKKNKLMLTFVIACLLSLIAELSWADGNYPCVLRLAKTDCWPDYQITVQPIDASTGKPIGSPVVLEKNSSEIEVLIPCEAEQDISFKAMTLPAVWGATENTQYPSTQFWESPEQLPSGANRWIISLCFASDFSSVPIPLSQKATCVCTFPKIENSDEVQAPALQGGKFG